MKEQHQNQGMEYKIVEKSDEAFTPLRTAY